MSTFRMHIKEIAPDASHVIIQLIIITNSVESTLDYYY